MDALKRRRINLLLLGYHTATVVIISAFLLTGTFAGGPCNPDTPGPGLLVLFAVGLVTIGLCLAGIYLTIRNRANKYFLIINLLALAIWIGCFVYGINH